jgi:hypothetical protein
MGEFTKSSEYFENKFTKKFSTKQARQKFMKEYKPEKLRKIIS